MFTERFLFLWVTQVVSNGGSVRVSGVPFDDEFGLPPYGSRYYSGELYCISASSVPSHGSGVISVAHSAYQGMHWRLDTELELPDAPFLLTSHPNVCCAINGAPNAMNCQSLSMCSEAAEIAVAGIDWCGIVQVRRGIARFLAIFAEDGWTIKFPLVARCASDASDLIFFEHAGDDIDNGIWETPAAGEP